MSKQTGALRIAIASRMARGVLVLAASGAGLGFGAQALAANNRANAAVPDAGLYCVSAATLNANISSAGASTRLKSAGFQLTNRGVALPWFPNAASDKLCFYGEGLVDNQYANANVYKIGKVTLGKGSIMPVQTGTVPLTEAPPGLHFQDRVWLEPERTYQPTIHQDPNADIWYAGRFGNASRLARELSETLATPDVAPGQVATVRVYLQGASAVNGAFHVVTAYLNGTALTPSTNDDNDGVWSGMTPHVLEGSISTSLLNPSGDNTLRLVSESTGTSIVYLDAIEVLYARSYQAKDGALRFWADGTPLATVRGFGTPDVRIIDVTNPVAPVQLAGVRVAACATGSGYCATFAPQPDRHYLVARESAARAPAVTPDTPSNWWSRSNGAQYLVIAPQSLINGANYLAGYRSAEYSTAVVALEDVYDHANFGIPDPAAIRRFIERTRSWSVPPSFYVLVGKMSIDPRDYLKFGTGLLPAPMVATPWGLFASVNWYADLKGGDGVPDVVIGHIPVVDSQELVDYVDKKLRPYEQSSGGFKDHALVFADNPEGLLDKAFDVESNEIAALLETRGPVASVLHPTGGDPAVTRADLLAELNAGVGYWNYRGHASLVGLTAENILGTAHLGELENRMQTPLLGAFTCYVGNGTYPGFDSFVERMLFDTEGGIAGAFAATGPSENTPALTLNRAFVLAGFVDASARTLGEAARQALAAMAAEGTAPSFMPAVYAVFGDPAIPLDH